MGKFSSAFFAGLTVIASLLISLVVFDGLFRVYETWYIKPKEEPQAGFARLDDLNYNEDNVSVVRPADQLRILYFGDSFAFGITTPPFTPAGQTQSLLQNVSKTADTTAAQIINLGEPTVSFAQYDESLKHWTSKLEWDGAVFSIYTGNDTLDPVSGIIPDNAPRNFFMRDQPANIKTGAKRLQGVEAYFPFRMFDFVRFLYTRAKEGNVLLGNRPAGYNLLASEKPDPLFNAILADEARAMSPAYQPQLIPSFVDLIHFAQDVGTLGKTKDVVVLLAPSRLMLSPTLAAQAATQAGISDLDPELPLYLIWKTFAVVVPHIPVLNLKPDFEQAQHAGASLFYPKDIHPTIEGNTVIAHRLADYIANAWLHTPLAPVQTGPAPAETPQRLAVFQTVIAPLISPSSQSDVSM
ncbi:SGNH/GDSL hydrolase family protein [Desulfovibrio inopinatus]|uniref:SGNH/GDSL hydrolase family protein n=1 Tax=Desulfovibrio inopinatus TaxID=102109 RepID=UPI00041DAA69|nr:SGNH/GDSL hydrolase family protein [Desulfovibrio inopinatus]